MQFSGATYPYTAIIFLSAVFNARIAIFGVSYVTRQKYPLQLCHWHCPVFPRQHHTLCHWIINHQSSIKRHTTLSHSHCVTLCDTLCASDTQRHTLCHWIINHQSSIKRHTVSLKRLIINHIGLGGRCRLKDWWIIGNSSSMSVSVSAFMMPWWEKYSNLLKKYFAKKQLSLPSPRVWKKTILFWDPSLSVKLKEI